MGKSVNWVEPPAHKTDNFQQKAYNYVKTRIINRDFKPRQYISDSQIAKELDTSRTPVREALRLLEHEGLLTRQSRRGWQVYSLSLEDIHEIFDIKVALESMIARRAAECNDKEKKDALSDALERMKESARANDHVAWREADTELHHIIFSMCGSKRASRMVNDLNNQWYRVRIGLVAMEGRVERSNREHDLIVSGILAGNGTEAESRMIEHLNNLRHELVRVLTNLVLPFAENGI